MSRRPQSHRRRRALGAECFVMVVGGLPAGSKDMAARAPRWRTRCRMLAHGRGVGVRIALEPLHPVYAADRSCLTLLSEALDLCAGLERRQGPIRWLGACIDVYHVWWDPNLSRDIARAGAAKRFSASMSATGWCRPRTC